MEIKDLSTEDLIRELIKRVSGERGSHLEIQISKCFLIESYRKRDSMIIKYEVAAESHATLETIDIDKAMQCFMKYYGD